ncbi:ribonuclease domain-containing protein [Corynebacterium nuruki]|uniref:ribonuclease domain-containing protein n=1 Tax=Corynebacterium nuruki TaxID=1032851 RepID=UPI00024861D6|nr:ribonuclease domain-containing protein [Corynebacterium nuruki]
MNSGNNTPRGKIGAVVGAVVVLVAGYFGVDAALDDGGSGTDTTARTSSAARATGATGTGGTAGASGTVSAGGDSCAVDTLPTEADEVIDAVLDGGPFDHPGDDGKHFGNYEGALPKESGSYYREYTVDTPGVHHRGARRIVVGGGSDTDPDVWYYTDDHYASFCSIPDAED